MNSLRLIANPLSYIDDFEDDRLSYLEVIELFSHLIKTGLAWELQGFYGGTATSLIEDGVLDINGTILLS